MADIVKKTEDIKDSSIDTKDAKDVAGKDVKEKETSLSVTHEHEKKKQAFVTRTIWTIVMIAFFFTCLLSGHLALISVVFLLQTLTFKEIISLTAEPARDKKLPFNKLLNWYFLFATIYYLDSESFFNFFQESIYDNKILSLLAIHHKIISYTSYIAGFIFFVATLQKGYYKFQFAQLCMTHTTLILVVFQSHLIIDNILNGLIWFFLPVGLVIVNDIFAYLCGITFGRTQLIAISPKKTVEGFVGAWVCTGLFALLFAFFLSKSSYLICPATNLTTNIFNYPRCDPNPVFISQIYQLPANLVEIFHLETISLKPIYIHALNFATFASLIAPFGGFFASGLKRAFGIKDFGDTIPGHGGITDRLDCQFFMGSFSYLYIQTFVSISHVNIGNLLQLAIMNLSIPQVVQLVKSLLKYLNNSGVVDDNKLTKIFEILDVTIENA